MWPRAFGLDSVSPPIVGPLGGIVLLLHGIALPYSAIYHGEANILIGDAHCPFLPHRSDPKGTFLACGPLPASAQALGRQSKYHTAPVVVNGSSPLFLCATCAVTYSPALQANATLALTHLRGAAGDVVTIVGQGEWTLLEDSYGHHEQLIATVDGHDALPRHPSSTAVTRPSAEQPWRVELSLPPTTAGQHKLRVSLDRLWHDVKHAHGTIALDGASEATVTVLPSITGLGVPRSAHMGRLMRIQGSGFSRTLHDNAVWFGATPCAVLSAAPNELVCEVGTHAASATLAAGDKAPRNKL